MCLTTPDSIISQPAPVVSAIRRMSCGSRCTSILLHPLPLRNIRAPGVGVRLKVGLTSAPVSDVNVHLGGREVRVPQHLLDAAEVGAALEQVRREGVAQE